MEKRDISSYLVVWEHPFQEWGESPLAPLKKGARERERERMNNLSLLRNVIYVTKKHLGCQC